jgi:TP901 family phage tail tape measure protein
MSLKVGELFGELRLDSGHFDRGLGKAKSSLGGMQTALKAGVLAGAAAGLALGGIALKIGSDFNEAFNTIKVGTGATGDALDGLKDDFRAVARSVPQDVGTVAGVIADLNTRLDLTGPALQQASREFLDFARVNKVDVAGAVRDVTRLMNALGIEADDASLLMDKLTKAGQLSGIGVDRLTQLVTEAGPAFEELGFDLDRSIALFAQMEKVGARPEELLSSMNLALNTLAREGFTNAEDAFAEYMRRIEEAPDILQATTIANELFGARAGSKIAADLREGVFAVDEWMDAIANAGGTMDGLAEDTLTLRERLGRLRNTLLVAVEPTVTKVFKAVEDAIQRVEPHALRLGALLEEWLPVAFAMVGEAVERVRQEIDNAQPFLDMMRLGFETIFEAAVDLGRWLMENEKVLIGVVAAVGLAIAVAFGPVSAAVLAIVGIVALVGFLRQNFADEFGRVQQIVGSVVAAVSSVIQTVFGALRAFWIRWGDDIREFASKTFEQIAAIVRSALDLIDGVIRFVLMAIRAFWDNWGDTILAAVRVTWEAIKDLTGVAWNLIKDAIDAILTVIRGVLEVFAGLFTGDWRRMWDGAKEILRGTTNGMIAILNGLIGAAEAVVNAIGNAFNSIPPISIPGWVPGIGGNSFGLPNIPRATLPRIPSLGVGGIIPGSPGEPVLMIGHGGEEVRRREDVGGTSTTIVHAHINAPNYIGPESSLAEPVKRLLVQFQRTGVIADGVVQ